MGREAYGRRRAKPGRPPARTRGPAVDPVAATPWQVARCPGALAWPKHHRRGGEDREAPPPVDRECHNARPPSSRYRPEKYARSAASRAARRRRARSKAWKNSGLSARLK